MSVVSWAVPTGISLWLTFFFFFQAEDGIRDYKVTGVQTCALPISEGMAVVRDQPSNAAVAPDAQRAPVQHAAQSEIRRHGRSLEARLLPCAVLEVGEDRKSTRLNSSHLVISYAVFCLKKKKKT